jgi:hypothetical protein
LGNIAKDSRPLVGSISTSSESYDSKSFVWLRWGTKNCMGGITNSTHPKSKGMGPSSQVVFPLTFFLCEWW